MADIRARTPKIRIRNRAGRAVRRGHSVEAIRHAAAKNTANPMRPVSASSHTGVEWMISGVPVGADLFADIGAKPRAEHRMRQEHREALLDRHHDAPLWIHRCCAP